MQSNNRPAAPQVGVLQRFFVIELPEDEEENLPTETYILFNPEIVKGKGEQTGYEGCLSIPGYVGEVARKEQITVKGLNERGHPVRYKLEGYLARVFAPFAETGISVDLVGTSQAAVSVTLDRVPGGVEGRGFRDLVERLEALGTVQVRHPCAVVSIVGRRIRSALHELGPALAAFRLPPFRP